mmetsp:Transcript_6182/g.19829  ORF Transcript_6182/g.19829 Transcript_6182/m.19829 type:complete len:367 (+) Transcript_6182:79-1179(+)
MARRRAKVSIKNVTCLSAGGKPGLLLRVRRLRVARLLRELHLLRGPGLPLRRVRLRRVALIPAHVRPRGGHRRRHHHHLVAERGLRRRDGAGGGAVLPLAVAVAVCVGLGRLRLRGGLGRSSQRRVVVRHLLPDELLEAVAAEVLPLELERAGKFGAGLVRLQVQRGHEGVLQRVLHGAAAPRVEGEHGAQEVEGLWVDEARQHRRGEAVRALRWKGGVVHGRVEENVAVVGEVEDEPARLFRRDKVQLVRRRLAEAPDNLADLVDVVVAGEQRLAQQELAEDAAAGPDVYCLSVLLACEHDLRRAVPPRHDVLRQLPRRAEARREVGLDASSEAQVADLEIAIRVDEEVRRLQVAVQHVGRVHVL